MSFLQDRLRVNGHLSLQQTILADEAREGPLCLRLVELRDGAAAGAAEGAVEVPERKKEVELVRNVRIYRAVCEGEARE